MKQTDSKHILVIFVGVLSTLCVETCPKNHFQLPDSLCCPNCPEGWYVAKNCSKRAGDYTVDCRICRRCEETGQITVSKCTQFADTQCANDEPVTTMVTTHPTLLRLGQRPQITLYGCSFVVVAVFMLAVIVSVCFIRISKSGESDESSAGEPFNIKDTETV
ncbi:uncharacterized protein LOC120473471 isoform X2 [Pimephales promelas]|uniref:uncharacterized protein LOC120473471 isoform X2 n=1 Tax=Pimephales promelas TaxID=90988 RepID=UPI001955EBE3|nr:uncharacterized protein LOC120473471 isoform X2 [Pimephales promelas]